MMMMDGEINNFIMVWTVAAATMCYCHTIGKLISQGTPRLIALLPAIVLLLLLPLRLTSIHLGGPSSFFLGWLSTFKLLLFAFGKGPLSPNPPLSLPHFVPLALLPIKFQHQNNNNPTNPKTHQNGKNHHPSPQITKTDNNVKSPLTYAYATTVFILAALIPLYGKKELFHPKFIFFLYSLHMYAGLEFFFALASTFTEKLLGVQLEPQFDRPYLCTSLQDFWGKRWNLSVNRVLHPTVYEPVVGASRRVIGRKWAPLPGVLATFAVSAVMHELIFYYIKREERTWEAWEPSWDATCFFVLHGVCLDLEVALKKALPGRWRLPRAVSWVHKLRVPSVPTAHVGFLRKTTECKESRIGKQPVVIPSNVTIKLEGQDIQVKGPLGELSLTYPREVKVERQETGTLRVSKAVETRRANQMHGLFRTLTDNLVVGVSKGFEKKLELIGVGYRATVEGNEVVLNLGFSHPVRMPIPEGLKVKVEENTKITISGYDKSDIGQFAASIRKWRPPEPYKGKGIKYADEVVRRKEGKAGKKK